MRASQDPAHHNTLCRPRLDFETQKLHLGLQYFSLEVLALSKGDHLLEPVVLRLDYAFSRVSLALFIKLVIRIK